MVKNGSLRKLVAGGLLIFLIALGMFSPVGAEGALSTKVLGTSQVVLAVLEDIPPTLEILLTPEVLLTPEGRLDLSEVGSLIQDTRENFVRPVEEPESVEEVSVPDNNPAGANPNNGQMSSVSSGHSEEPTMPPPPTTTPPGAGQTPPPPPPPTTTPPGAGTTPTPPPPPTTTPPGY